MMGHHGWMNTGTLLASTLYDVWCTMNSSHCCMCWHPSIPTKDGIPLVAPWSCVCGQCYCEKEWIRGTTRTDLGIEFAGFREEMLLFDDESKRNERKPWNRFHEAWDGFLDSVVARETRFAGYGQTVPYLGWHVTGSVVRNDRSSPIQYYGTNPT